LLVLSCIASLWVSGCSGDASSTAGPTPSVPTSSAPTSTPTPERETPEEFVRRWVEADTHMQNTGDGTEYRAMSAKCSGCVEYADRIRDIYAAGGYVRTRGWMILRVRDARSDDEGRTQVTIDVKSTRTRYKENRESQPTTLPGGRLTYLISMRGDGDSWAITNAEQVAR
jgi:hypothetical protein